MRKTIPVLLASAAIALPLALGGAAHAAPPDRGIVLYDAFGTPVAVLQPLARDTAAPDTAAQEPALSMLREIQASMQPDAFFPADFLARQDAMMRLVMQRMESLAAAPIATPGMVEAALGAAPGAASEVVVTSYSSGNGTCSQTVTYSYRGNRAAPEVAVRKVGDACGATTMPQMQSVPAAQPIAPAQPTPRAAPDGSRLIQVDYAHPAPAARRLHG